jgi:F0F1-type ATP synthase assembly protein I
VFIPIAPLRGVLIGFFYLIIFSAAPLQIAACLILGLAVYSLNIPVFARKAI